MSATGHRWDRDAVAAEFSVAGEWEDTSMTAFGVAAHAAGTVAGVARERRSRGDVTWARVRADEPR